MRVLCGIAMLTGLTGWGIAWAAPPWEAPVDIGGRRELFVDHYLVESLEGAALHLHEPRPAGTALQFDQPWEGRYCGYVTVFKDGDRYRMYYRGLPDAGKDGSAAETTCYAESADGIHWVKPELGLHTVHGSAANNVVLANMAPYSHNFAPFLDARPGVPAAERYKALGGTQESGLAGFVSEDGLRWRKMQDGPVITKGALDSQNVAFWSESEGCYVCYLRTWSGGGFEGFRTISRCTSPDFLTWTDPVPMDFGGTPMEHLYTNQTAPYYRAPHLYIATAARFMPGRRVVSREDAQRLGIEGRYDADCSDIVLMSTRGGTQYARTFMEGFLKPGIGLENWTSRTNYPAWGIVPIGEKEMAIYVQHNYGQPTHHLVRYVLRPDGFISVRAPYAGGEMTTKPLLFSGSELSLNFATSAAGSVRVEIQDAHGAPLEGFALADSEELIGNLLDRTARWNGQSVVGHLAGTPVRLRFVMKDADLFALQFR